MITDSEAEPPVQALVTDVYATVSTVSSTGKATVMLGGDDDGLARPAPDELVLNLTLTAASDNDDITFPLDMGAVMAKVTFTDDAADMGGDTFEDAFTDYVTVFMIRPAQCEMLFPVVSVLPNEMPFPWDTAISITNPAYPGSEKADGALRFTFYGIDAEPVVVESSILTGASIGLDADGDLPAGNTFQALVSMILRAANWGDSFRGHVHVQTDYTNCSGIGWVTDWMGANQAYSAVVIDADTGMDE